MFLRGGFWEKLMMRPSSLLEGHRLDSIPGAAQEKMREKQMWPEGEIRAQC